MKSKKRTFKKTTLLLAYPREWKSVPAYTAFQYEGHSFFVHKCPPSSSWRVSHSCGAAAGPLCATRAGAVSASLAVMKAKNIDKAKLDFMTAGVERVMKGVPK